MDIRKKLGALGVTIKTVFKDESKKPEAADKLKGVLYDVMPVTGAATNIAVLAGAPGMSEFKSERKHGIADDTVHTIVPRTWEATLDIEREKIEDDDVGQVPAKVRLMARKKDKHYGALAVASLGIAQTAKLEDGKAFFHADRGNLVTGEFNKAMFEKALNAMLAMKDSNGDKVVPEATHLLVGVESRVVAEEILLRERLDNGQSNPNYKRVELIVDPRIEGRATYLIAGNEGMTPIAIAERIKADKIVAKHDENSDKAFESDVFSWGLRGRYDAAYQAAQFIVCIKGS